MKNDLRGEVTYLFCCCVRCLLEECWHDFRTLAVILVSEF